MLKTDLWAVNSLGECVKKCIKICDKSKYICENALGCVKNTLSNFFGFCFITTSRQDDKLTKSSQCKYEKILQKPMKPTLHPGKFLWFSKARQ